MVADRMSPPADARELLAAGQLLPLKTGREPEAAISAERSGREKIEPLLPCGRLGARARLPQLARWGEEPGLTAEGGLRSAEVSIFQPAPVVRC